LSGGAAHAFVWQKGAIDGLEFAFAANAGWELQNALFINDSGRIVGTGVHSGEAQSFILDFSAGNNSPTASAGPNQTFSAPVWLFSTAAVRAIPTGCPHV